RAPAQTGQGHDVHTIHLPAIGPVTPLAVQYVQPSATLEVSVPRLSRLLGKQGKCEQAPS
ncbi:MAG: hypothetical protein WB819_02370, partial [Terriglobia bacterium]